MDQAPPPPYSETDIYSNASSGSRLILTPAASNVDNVSVAGSPYSDDSSAESIIHTPPYSPGGSLVDENNQDHLSHSSSARAFFESRAPLQLSSDTLIIHTITITENTQPADLPFPYPEEKWLERDVLPEDWQTFINYLIPYHADITNREVADRKQKAELVDERMERLTLNTDSGNTDPAKVDAQLSPLRQFHSGPSLISNMDTVIREWNEGFFGPRGLLVEMAEPVPEARAMPGSWTEDPAEAYIGSGSSGRDARGSRRGLPGGLGGGWIRADNTGFHIGRGLVSADRRGFRLGGNALVADNNGFRIGNVLVADGSGFKLGPIKADSSGLRFGGRGCGPAHQPREPFHGRHSGFRPPSPYRQRGRSRSVSSSLSDSSSTSVESTGSLPDWDKLNDAQLPVMKQSVIEWLTNPEKPITKETVDNIKKEVKAAKSGAKSQQNSDAKALRQEVRDMLREFRELQRTQKRAKKSAKRERRSLKKIARKQDRIARKLEKKIAKKGKRREEPHLWGNPMNLAAAMPAVAALQTPPGRRPTDHVGQEAGCHQPPFSMGATGAGWPFMVTSQAGADSARAAQLRAQGYRIEAEARATEHRQRAEERRQRAESYAESSRRKAEMIRRKAEARAAVARRKAEASSTKSHAMQMKADVGDMRMRAAHLQDEKAKLKLLDVAEKLEEEVVKMSLEGERMMAEAVQLGEDAERELQDGEREQSQQQATAVGDRGQESGTIHD